MERRDIMIYVAGAILLLGFYFIIDTSPSLTGATVWGSSRCVSPAAAINEININGCERINIGTSECEAQGLVEIRCPLVAEPETTGTEEPAAGENTKNTVINEPERPSRIDIFKAKWSNRFYMFRMFFYRYFRRG